MASIQSPKQTKNRFESTLGGITVGGQAHSLSAWFVLALRLTFGYAFLAAGLEKVLEAGWSAQGYLANVAAVNGNPLAGTFAWMAETAWFVSFVDLAVPWGELLIGIGLVVGLLVRLAAFWGAFMMAMFYFGNWSIEHGIVNSDLAYVVVFLAIAAFGAGRILGLDAYVESYEFADGRTLLEKYPRLDYVLG
ncbi:DoxX family protein [Halorubellus sp. JP-L1]|uniref:DoxX family protein n=1 Tax=Halorubellus sp. JP-L1 TaxID=2715753 RepID=UPI00140CDDC8|nr:DoxX family protein [Halorubellus sp. JP-L1]NHN43288.1 DoxX family protein [Halorubellus sp. JP-L1]